jgi:hypothetical protein
MAIDKRDKGYQILGRMDTGPTPWPQQALNTPFNLPIQASYPSAVGSPPHLTHGLFSEIIRLLSTYAIGYQSIFYALRYMRVIILPSNKGVNCHFLPYLTKNGN